MDKKILVNTLNNIFAEINQKERKYAEVWLSEVDFGGMYRIERYALNIVAEDKIENYTTIISDIFDIIHRDAKDVLKYIWHIKLYNPDERVERHWDDIEVYNEEMAVR